MAGKLRLVIVTPEGKTFDDDVEQVVLPGVEGQIGVLPGHVPLLTQIMPGELDLKAHSKGDELAVGGGFAAVFGVIWIGAAASMGAPAPFVLFGVVFVGFAIFGAVNGASKASAHQSAESLHQSQRAEILRKIEAARRD